jgi:hypothetical protein
MPAEFTRISTLPNSAQTANLNDRPRRGWRANSGPQQHKAKTEGNENQSEENSTEELAHFLQTRVRNCPDYVEIIAPAEVPTQTVPRRCWSADIGGRRVRR